MAPKTLSLLLTTLRSEETLDRVEKDVCIWKSVAGKLRDARQSHGSTHITVSIESPTATPRSRFRTSRVFGEMTTQNLTIPFPPFPPTPTASTPTPTRKRITRFSIPIILPEDFPISALIRRAHIRRRTRVQAARIRPLPPLPCATALPPSRTPSQRSTQSTAREECRIRPLPIIPWTIPEGSSEGSTDTTENTWSGDPERHAIASALLLPTHSSALQLKFEKHDEHFLYDPQLFRRPLSTTLNIDASLSVGKSLTTNLPIASSSFITASPIGRSPVCKTSNATTVTRQRRSSAPDHPTVLPSVRPHAHKRSRSAQMKLHLAMDPELTALRMPHPPSSFRGVGRGGATKADGTLTPTEYRSAPSTSDPARPPSLSSNSSRSESEPASQNKQHGTGRRGRFFVDRSVPDTPIGGWFGRGLGRAPTPIDWELLDTVLGTKGTGRKSFSSVKTLDSSEKESIHRSRQDSSTSTTAASRSSRSRSRGRPKKKTSIPFALRTLSGSRRLSSGCEEVPPMPQTSRTWA